MSKADLVKLLGRPDDSGNRTLVYFIGLDRGFGIDCEYFNLKLDKSGHLVIWGITQG